MNDATHTWTLHNLCHLAKNNIACALVLKLENKFEGRTKQEYTTAVVMFVCACVNFLFSNVLLVLACYCSCGCANWSLAVHWAGVIYPLRLAFSYTCVLIPCLWTLLSSLSLSVCFLSLSVRLSPKLFLFSSTFPLSLLFLA